MRVFPSICEKYESSEHWTQHKLGFQCLNGCRSLLATLRVNYVYFCINSQTHLICTLNPIRCCLGLLYACRVLSRIGVSVFIRDPFLPTKNLFNKDDIHYWKSWNISLRFTESNSILKDDAMRNNKHSAQSAYVYEWKRSYHTNLSWHLIISYCLFNYRITKNEQIFVSLHMRQYLSPFKVPRVSFESFLVSCKRVVIVISTETKIGIIVECLLNRNHIIYILSKESQRKRSLQLFYYCVHIFIWFDVFGTMWICK